MTGKRFKLVYIGEDDEWVLYDSAEGQYYDIDISEYQKEMERLKRNHQNLHEKYEQMEKKYQEYHRKYSKIISNNNSAKRVYLNLKECFEND